MQQDNVGKTLCFQLVSNPAGGRGEEQSWENSRPEELSPDSALQFSAGEDEKQCNHWTPSPPANSSKVDNCRRIYLVSQLKGTCQCGAVVAPQHSQTLLSSVSHFPNWILLLLSY